MTIERGFANEESAYDSEAVDLGSADYEPKDAQGNAVICRGLLISVAGAVKILTHAGNTVTYPSGALAPQFLYPIKFRKIFQSGTTATGIFAFS